jgi:cell division protein FtsB
MIKNEITKDYDVPRMINAGTQMIETEVKLKQFIQAEKTFKKLQNIIVNLKFKNNINPSSKLQILKAQGVLYRAQGNFKQSDEVALKQIFLIDSVNIVSETADKKWQEELNTISLNRVALNFKIDKIMKENKINSQRSKLWIVSILSIFIICFLTALYFRRKGLIILAKNKLLIAEQNSKLTELKNKQLESEIDSKKRDLSDFAISLIQNQEWAKELAEKIKYIKASTSKEQLALLTVLEQEILNKITVDSDTQEFYERLDKLSDSFYSELTKQFTKLSKNEIRLCSLLRLKMDSRSIATLQNISLASFNTCRYRLRKKLNLHEGVDLDDFIQNL